MSVLQIRNLSPYILKHKNVDVKMITQAGSKFIQSSILRNWHYHGRKVYMSGHKFGEKKILDEPTKYAALNETLDQYFRNLAVLFEDEVIFTHTVTHHMV